MALASSKYLQKHIFYFYFFIKFLSAFETHIKLAAFHNQRAY